MPRLRELKSNRSVNTDAQGRHAAVRRRSLAAGYVRRSTRACVLAAEPVLYPDEMKVAEVLRQLQDDGWYTVATRGSHRQLKHPLKPGRVTVAGKPSDDLAPGTLNIIRKQAGLK